MSIRPEVLMIAAAAIVGGLLLTGKNAGVVGQNLGSAAVDMADGLISGVVLEVGEKVGLPRTDYDRGREALAQGDYWNASFLLPAGDFISGSWRRLTS